MSDQVSAVRARVEAAALEYHKAEDGTGEGEYGCPGLSCPGVQRLANFWTPIVEAALRAVPLSAETEAVTCPVCNGQGQWQVEEGTDYCQTCGGCGQVEREPLAAPTVAQAPQPPTQQLDVWRDVTCERCMGKGTVGDDWCGACGGAGAWRECRYCANEAPNPQASEGPTDEQVADFAASIGGFFQALREAPVWEKLDEELYDAWVNDLIGRAADLLERMPQKRAEAPEGAAPAGATAEDIENLGKYVEYNGPEHDDDCPGDDTCECSWKSILASVNKLCRLSAPEPCPSCGSNICTHAPEPCEADES
jgi:hypothetical protein